MSHGNSTVSVTIDAPHDKLNNIEYDKDGKITWTTMTPQQISIWIDRFVSLLLLLSAVIIVNFFYLLDDRVFFSRVHFSFSTFFTGHLSIFNLIELNVSQYCHHLVKTVILHASSCY